MKNKLFMSVIGLVLGLMTQYTSANTISITHELDGDLISKGGAPWQASCDETGPGPCMMGLEGPATASMSASIATAYDKQGSPLSELTFLNSLLGLGGTDLITGTTDIAGSGNSFETSFQYFAIKQSSYIMYFENLTGESLRVMFDNEFSHVTGFGQQLTPPSEVPLPAAVWLFGSALLGLGAIGRRKK
jgi:hypothetical protein